MAGDQVPTDPEKLSPINSSGGGHLHNHHNNTTPTLSIDNAAVAHPPESGVELVEFDPSTSAPAASASSPPSRDHAGQSSGTTGSRNWKERWKGRNNNKHRGQSWRTGGRRASGEEEKRGEDQPGSDSVPEGYGGEEDKAADMKFSHSIQFNAVQEWSAHYIAYSNLKKLIYTLEKQVHQAEGHEGDAEASPLLDSGSIDTDAIFRQALDAELEKICSFYNSKEPEVLKEVAEVVSDEEAYVANTEGINIAPVEESVVRTRTLSFGDGRRGSQPRSSGILRHASTISDSIRDDDSIEDSPTLDGSRRRSAGGWYKDSVDHSDGQASDLGDSTFLSRIRSGHRPSVVFDDNLDPDISDLYHDGVILKKRLISVYVSVCELRSYVQLNKTGFAKALKKYDKILDRSIRRDYLNNVVAPSYPFTETAMQQLDGNIARIERVYAEFITRGDISLSRRELRLHLREHVVWERNTVWREMIGIERKAQAANMGIRRTLLGGEGDPEAARRQGDISEVATKEFITPVGRCPVPEWLFSGTFATLVIVLVLFFVLLSVPILDRPEQQNCLAMLVFVSLLWATEVIPLFVTSMLIPFLVVVLRIMRTDEKPYQRMEPKEATGAVFAAMWTPVIMLLLGGFTIAAALSKHDIARRMATFVLSKAGTRPRTVLVTNMFVSMVLSMWISNVAAPVLCFSIIQPMLRNLPSDSRFSKALILGIALASNVGGAASPIASPQNIIALQNMYPAISWGTWFFISLPVCIISILLIWVILLVTFHPGRGTTIVPIRPVKDRYTGVQWFITFTTLVTIVLWCVSHQLESTFGDMGVIAIIPLVVFFGTGILTKEDFNNFLWTIIILAAGGLCLGKAVESSGLLLTVAGAITERVADFELYSVLVVFAALILVIATFISHTVAALIILPLIHQVGANMDHPHPNLLVMGGALTCSVAMALPTSGFPNMTAIMMEIPETGQRYLRVQHFISRGVPASIVSFLVIITIGYGLMVVAGL